MQLRRILALLLTLAWAAQIFWLSTASFTGDHTESMLVVLLSQFNLHVSSEILEMLNLILRKSAHVVEYAILSILLYFVFLGRDRFFWRARYAYWCIAWASAYALTDEFHQLFIRGRGASLIDCCIDGAGAAVGMVVIHLCSRVSSQTGCSTTVQHETDVPRVVLSDSMKPKTPRPTEEATDPIAMS